MAFGREHRLAMPATTDTANTQQCRVTVSTRLPLLPLSQSSMLHADSVPICAHAHQTFMACSALPRAACTNN